MKHGRIGSESELREAAQISTLTSDLDRFVQFVNLDVVTEEEHAGVFERSDVAYPLLARTLAARRDNLGDAENASVPLGSHLFRGAHGYQSLTYRNVAEISTPSLPTMR